MQIITRESNYINVIFWSDHSNTLKIDKNGASRLSSDFPPLFFICMESNAGKKPRDFRDSRFLQILGVLEWSDQKMILI